MIIFGHIRKTVSYDNLPWFGSSTIETNKTNFKQQSKRNTSPNWREITMYQHLQFKNILVALDGSDSSRMAYEVNTMKMLLNWTKKMWNNTYSKELFIIFFFWTA